MAYKKDRKEKDSEKAKVEKKNLKLIILILAIMIVLLVIVLSLLIFKTQLSELWHRINGDVFEYNGITFTKGKLGNLQMYATQLAIYRQVENRTFYYMLYLRNDPRVLDKEIQANVTSKLERKVYVSFDTEPLECNGTALAAYKMGEFIDALGVNKEGAFASQEAANLSGYNGTDKTKNCSDAEKGKSVILFKASETNQSFIHQEGYCYVVEVADCKNIEASERLILALIGTMKKISANEQANETNLSQENFTNSS